MKTIKIIAFILLSFLVLILFSTVWNFQNQRAFQIIAVFLSITVGFSITALSIIATSSFSKNLYKIESKNDNSKSLLHDLVAKFQTSTTIFVITIASILVFEFLPDYIQPIIKFKSYPISLNTIIKSVIWYLTILSFIAFLNLFHLFKKFVIKSATK